MSLSGDRALAQQFSIGAIGGVRATDDLNGTLSSESKRYIVGPTAEVSLPLHLSFEFDALYRRFGFTGYQSSPLANSITRVRANSWEFPLLVKFHLPFALAHPFAGAGYAPRVVHGTAVSSGSFLSGMTSNPPMDIFTTFVSQRSSTGYAVSNGVVGTAGVELRAGPIHVSPQLRYVHWSAPFLDAAGGDGSFRFESTQDEFFVLVGVSWR
ncbi:MAG TPA: hypothetical protein VEV17_13685 [Bryobacteraceae bacterium]|nr:hypothetical protein [Bryobacteraceae bacterium]